MTLKAIEFSITERCFLMSLASIACEVISRLKYRIPLNRDPVFLQVPPHERNLVIKSGCIQGRIAFFMLNLSFHFRFKQTSLC